MAIFEYSNYLAQSEATLLKTNFNEQIERNFEQVGTNYYKEAKTPEEVKAKIRADLILKEAVPLARKAAYEFVTALAGLTNVNPASFEKFAKEKNSEINKAIAKFLKELKLGE